MSNTKETTETISHASISGVTCRSCWWQEGGRCYVAGVKRIKNPDGIGTISTKMADTPCEKHTGKRQVLERVFDGKKLIIASEKNGR